MTALELSMRSLIGLACFAVFCLGLVALARRIGKPVRSAAAAPSKPFPESERLSPGDSWLAVRTADMRRVAAAMAELLGGGQFVESTVREALPEAQQHGGTLLLPPVAGFILIVPGNASGAFITRLSSLLSTQVYAFESNDDHGLAIMLADGGRLIRDRYESPSAGEYRDVGLPLDGEPEPGELWADKVGDFAARVTTEPVMGLSSRVLWLKR